MNWKIGIILPFLSMSTQLLWAAPQDEKARGPLQWYMSCGSLLCGDDDVEASDIKVCTTEEVGMSCSDYLAVCGGFSTCGQLLVCSDRDPRAKACPI